MRFLKAVLLAGAVAAAIAPGMAEARGGRFGAYRGGGFRLGVAIGAPILAASYYAPRYYASPYVYAPAYSYAPEYAPPAYVQPYSQQAYPPQYSTPAYSQQYSPPANPQPAYAQQVPAPVQQAADYQYYCPQSNAYYPNVRECPRGWQRVDAQSPRS